LFLFGVAVSDLNVVIFAGQSAGKQTIIFADQTGWFNRGVTGRVGHKISAGSISVLFARILSLLVLYGPILLWPLYVSLIGQAIIFLPCGFFHLLSSFFFFFHRLISVVAEGTSTILLHMAWSANLECKSGMCCARLAGNAGPTKSLKIRHRTNSSGYIFATKAHIDNRKNTC